ncbi:MAG: hypothetical protein MJ149_02150 [Clostridia bacterium]|nr:hypothetical protein [Clostridia bacterium]
MSTMEIILIVCACCIPVLSILFLIPKKKGKEEAKPAENKQDSAKPAEVKEEVKEAEPEVKDDLQAEIMDFETYIKEQREATTKQEELEAPTDVTTLPYKEETQETVQINVVDNVEETKQELENLSPELKAMLLAGILDKKDFDKE